MEFAPVDFAVTIKSNPGPSKPQIKKPIESYEKRATRFAREEAAMRRGGSRAQLRTNLSE